ncbi:Tm-1-like ATP-binding domain-containing protein [Halopelagius fulvigenes]|uniref:Tm-1-like ATP-binding domain-containing protein n=1 Tax=Halopelagius fulvigenes TaxID=1198324 RepID=A0ABD5U2S4_9EURY
MTVALVGTLDTKGEEFAFARDVLTDHGVDVHVVDVGVMGDPAFEPDTTNAEVADRAGTTVESLRESGDRGESMDAMGRGAARVVEELHEEGALDGVLGLGGSGNTSVVTTAMRALPYGVPKLVVSTMASGDTRPYVGARDITMMYSVADIEGLNRLSRRIISNAALAMVGMVTNEADVEADDGPTVAVTMFGVTTPCVKAARAWLEERGYECIVFHATGTGGEAMENLVEQGVVDAVLDATTTELADELVGGVLSAGPDRLEAAGERGVPQVVSVGALDMVNFGPKEEVPEKFRDRHLHAHNPTVTLMRTTPEENAELGRVLAEKLNDAAGPTALFLPLRSVSMLDAEGEEFHRPEADDALFEAIRENVADSVELVELDADINDEAFAEAMAEKLHEFVEAT